MSLSTRSNRIHPSATFEIAAQAARLRAQGRDILSLGVGEPDFGSPEVAVEAARQALVDGHTRYAPTAGLPQLREAIAEHLVSLYGGPWTADHVTVTVGAKAALFELALALFGAGDEVILPVPYWVTFPEQIRFCGARPVPVQTSPAEGFRLTADAVEAAMDDATQAVILNSPSNPTGAVIEADELRAIVELCAERDVVVIADETYDRFVYDGPFPSASGLAEEFPDHVALVGSFSKTWAMTGWRVGYLLAKDEISSAVRKIQGHATSAPTTFAMYGALAALGQSHSEIDEMVDRFRRRRDLVMRRLADIDGVRCQPPAGAFYCFPSVRGLYGPSIPDSQTFCAHLLEEAGVATVPGSAFGADDHVRISFACSEEVLDAAFKRIEAMARELRAA